MEHLEEVGTPEQDIASFITRRSAYIAPLLHSPRSSSILLPKDGLHAQKTASVLRDTTLQSENALIKDSFFPRTVPCS